MENFDSVDLRGIGVPLKQISPLLNLKKKKQFSEFIKVLIKNQVNFLFELVSSASKYQFCPLMQRIDVASSNLQLDIYNYI